MSVRRAVEDVPVIHFPLCLPMCNFNFNLNQVVLQAGQLRWTAWKRFSSFAQLAQGLDKVYNQV
jgi:hypothetical protein